MTKQKRIAMIVSAIALIAVIVVGGTLAFFTSKDAKQNVFTLGKVSGTLTEDKSTDGTRRDDGGRDYSNYTPGSKLSKVPVVNVDSTSLPAYVRVKIEYTGLTDAQIVEVEEGLDVQSGWHKSTDGYFYYNSIVTPGSSTEPIFTKVTIPTSWGNEMSGHSFSMTLKADLIQSDNFTPTKDANGNIISWGDVTIEQTTSGN
jgi:predicted ribosomally synthesized peptide with SipW-like signal peptide